jgi:hypothetical protein
VDTWGLNHVTLYMMTMIVMLMLLGVVVDDTIVVSF